MKWKTIGVLGGLGPQATIDFYNKVLAYCQKKIKAHANEGYPEMVIYNCNFLPFSGKNKIRINPKLIIAAKSLEKAGADFIAILSITTSILFQKNINSVKKKVSIPVIDFVEEVVNSTKTKAKVIGLLGHKVTIKSKVLQSRFKENDIKTLTLNNADQNQLDKIIIGVMEGKANHQKRKIIMKMAGKLKKDGASLIVLGCTELPVLLGDLAKRKDVLDVTEVLAKAAVERAVS